MTSRTRSPSRPARWLLLLGGISSFALIVVAALDFGDPLESARQELRARADERSDLIQSAWSTLRRSPADLTVSADLAVFVGEAHPLNGVPEPVRATSSRLFSVLLDAANSAAALGDVQAAIARAEDALARVPDDPRAGEARLHLARWNAAQGRTAEVLRHRSDLLESPDRAVPFDGTALGLLACLVEPIDRSSAFEILSSELECLPAPIDRVLIEGDGEVKIAWDPWWLVLEERLRAAASSPRQTSSNAAPNWNQAFRRSARAAEAVRLFFGPTISATDDRWTLLSRQNAMFATRSFPAQQGVRVLAVRPESLVSSLHAAPRQTLSNDPNVVADKGSDSTFIVRFDHEPALSVARLPDEGRRWLEGTSIGFTLHKDDPLRAGRAEAFRLRVVRFGLVLLALAVLCASYFAARAMERSRRLARLRSTFVASVSHDLRTPIQSILLMSETLERGRVAAEKSRARYFSSIRQEAQRLRRFVEDLLDGARIDRGEGPRIERRDVDVAAFTSDLESAMRERAEATGGLLTVVQSALPESLYLDADGVHRAVWNLFENALRYGKSAADPPRVTIEISFADGVLGIDVRDEGPGIPARFRETVFNPFERARDAQDSTGVQGDTGTGLGLSIVQAITRAHGGDAQLVPSARGAHFTATFKTTFPEDAAGGAA